MPRRPLIILVCLLTACHTPVGPETSERTGPSSIDGIERVHEVNPRLLTGSSPDAIGYRSLQTLGVEVVLSVDGPMPPVDLIHGLGMQSIHLPIGYDGVPPEAMRSLVRLAREKPVETLYVHCHQGRHRGPAVAAILSQIRGQGSAEDGTAVLVACGTDPDYEGLWEAVEEVVIPTGSWQDAPLPASVEPASLVRQMVTIQALRDRLDSTEASSAENASILLLLQDAFVELKRRRDSVAPSRLDDWNDHLDRTITLLESLRSRPSFDASQRALIDTRCDACHTASW
ncbi:MAG TPA: hypothetical protein DCX60_02395 [Phycisphaerales bacterium]|nr:hypothetical protein [Phycisphaerales bacterium]